FEGAAVELVGTRLRHHVNHCARVAAKIGAVKVGLDLEFFHCLYGGPENDGEGQALVVVSAGIQEIFFAFAVAVGKNLGPGPAVIGPRPAHDCARNTEANTIYSGGENRQLDEVTAVERQLVHKPLANHATER